MRSVESIMNVVGGPWRVLDRELGWSDRYNKNSLCLPGGSDDKESSCNSGDLGFIPGLGRSPGENNHDPLQCSCLENSMEGGSWQAIVRGVTKRWTWLSNFQFLLSVWDGNYRMGIGRTIRKLWQESEWETVVGGTRMEAAVVMKSGCINILKSELLGTGDI